MNPRGWLLPRFNYLHNYLRQYLLHVLDIRDYLDSERFVPAYFDSSIEDRKAAAAIAASSNVLMGNKSAASSQSQQQQQQQQDQEADKGSIATIPPPLLSPEVWRDIDATNFKVRGPTYNVDKVKTISAPSLLKLIAIDLYEVPEPTQNVCAHPRNRVNLALQRGEKSWVFVMNIMVPGPPFLCFVVYMQGDPVSKKLKDIL